MEYENIGTHRDYFDEEKKKYNHPDMSLWSARQHAEYRRFGLFWDAPDEVAEEIGKYWDSVFDNIEKPLNMSSDKIESYMKDFRDFTYSCVVADKRIYKWDGYNTEAREYFFKAIAECLNMEYKDVMDIYIRSDI